MNKLSYIFTIQDYYMNNNINILRKSEKLIENCNGFTPTILHVATILFPFVYKRRYTLEH